jgi:hypothetical protein
LALGWWSFHFVNRLQVESMEVCRSGLEGNWATRQDSFLCDGSNQPQYQKTLFAAWLFLCPLTCPMLAVGNTYRDAANAQRLLDAPLN